MNGTAKGLVLALLLAGLAVIVFQAGPEWLPEEIGRKDFRAFWCGARVWLDGGNPYDAEAVQTLQKQEGLYGDGPGTFVNPPHALVWLAPWALLDFAAAQRLWLVAHFAVAVACLVLACKLNPGGRPVVELLWVLSFVPFWLVVFLGQMSLWITLFMLGAVWFRRTGRYFLCGFLLWLVCIKPQMGFLLVVGLVSEALFLRRWGLFAGFAAGAVLSLGPWWWSGAPWIPDGFPQEANPLAYYNSSLASQWVKWFHPAGWDAGRLCLVIPFLGLIHAGWMQWRAMKERRELSWRRLASLSPLYAPYIWSYDFIALAFIETAGTRSGWGAGSVRFLIRAGAWAALVLFPDMGYSFWVAPALVAVIWFMPRGDAPSSGRGVI